MLDKRELIIGKAIERFVVFGIHKTTLNQIATAAGLKLPSFYHYFSNKELLVLAAYEKINKDYKEALSLIHHPKDSLELKLKKVIKLRYRFLKKYFMLNFWDSNPAIAYSDGQAKDYLISIKDQEVDYLKALFITSMAKNEISKFEPTEIAKLFIDSISGLMAVTVIPMIKTPHLIKNQLEHIYRQQVALLALFVNGSRAVK